MFRLSSLTARLVFAVIATSVLTFSTFVGLTFVRLEQGLERQAVELGRISEEKLRQKLDGEARLASARVEMLLDRVSSSLESMSQQADIVRAVSSGNVVDITERLQRAARAADLDGVVVVDAKMRVMGANDEKFDLIDSHRALQSNSLSADIANILSDNDRRKPTVLRRPYFVDKDLAKVIGVPRTSHLTFLAVQPLFDDFGDVFAALIGHRAIRATEPLLEEFSRLEGAALLVMSANRPLSSAGMENPSVALVSVEGSPLLKTNDGSYWSRCAETFDHWQTCALAPVSELHMLRDELVRIGETEGRSLARWLVLIAAGSIVIFAGVTLFLSQHIAKPLNRITNAVRAVARGDWKSYVTGTERRDEVGDIARAVVVLQRSLEERDRLRSNIAQAEEVKKRREVLEDAIRRFDRMMRSVLLSVSDTVETMDETARDLACMSVVAEGEAVEAAFVSEHTVLNVSRLRDATERLSSSISETVDRVKQATDAIDASSAIAESAAGKMHSLAEGAKDVDRIAKIIEDLAANANTVALKATAQIARADKDPEKLGELVTDIQMLCERISRANREAAKGAVSFRGLTHDTIEQVKLIGSRLEPILKQTKMIALAMERQDAATREIAANMLVAANGTTNVSSSVDRLKVTIEDARGASTKVVEKATDMADEAHRLDSTVKSFLREVTT